MRYVLLGLVFAFLSSCATYSVHEPIEAVEIVAVEGFSKDVIFSRSRQWFSEYFMSGESVIDYESAADGVIMGTGVATLRASNAGMTFNSVRYTIRLDVKDGRVRVTTKPVMYMVGNKGSRYVANSVKVDCEQHLAGLGAKVKKYIIEYQGKSSW